MKILVKIYMTVGFVFSQKYTLTLNLIIFLFTFLKQGVAYERQCISISYGSGHL